MVAILLLVGTGALLVASVLYVAWMIRYEPQPHSMAALVVVAGVLALGGAVVVELAGVEPASLGAMHRVLLFVTLGLTAAFLVSRPWRDMPIAGAVVVPIATVVGVALAASALREAPAATAGPLSSVAVLHIGAAMLGFLLFVPAYVLSVLFLNQQHRLKTKQLTKSRLPSLLTLERNAWRLLYIGFPLYSVGILLGAVLQESSTTGVKPEHIFSGASWCAYAYAVYRRATTGWRGRRAALTLMGAFVCTLGAVLMYMMR